MLLSKGSAFAAVSGLALPARLEVSLQDIVHNGNIILNKK